MCRQVASVEHAVCQRVVWRQITQPPLTLSSMGSQARVLAPPMPPVPAGASRSPEVAVVDG